MDRSNREALVRVPFMKSAGFDANNESGCVPQNSTVPPKYSDGPVIIEFDRLSSSLLAGAGVSVRYAGRPYLDVQDLGSATLGKPRLTAATDCAAPLSSQTAEANT